MTLEGVAAATTAVAALVTALVALIAAYWTRRSADRAADATVVAGLGQSQAAVKAARLQERAGREHTLESERRAVYQDFLRATDIFARTFAELPDVPYPLRKNLLDQRATAVVEARAGVAVLGSPTAVAAAEELVGLCSQLEKLALRRAVVRSAISALEANWCPRHAEWCQDPHHIAAHVAWGLLVDWGHLEDEDRWEKLDFLEFVLQDSHALEAEQIEQIRDVANNVACWSDMVGGWVRDPLLERFQVVQAGFVDAAYGSVNSVAG
ncbi:hypothetical protein OOK36_35690 [Streptomyces sp. NBC_00365]|uniref:hypothetical protein n=1 Tax=Streptomyces sp. NBC_00365 TaxID=2975726 RepID=UPI00225A8C3E|nr:hypothetical protein [Streptomyces sp. NBC_00365]MCX5094115.1 hypothetical protein [Streptomyces sp. NBC_00365]